MLNILDILEPSDFILVDEETSEVLILGDLIPHENREQRPRKIVNEVEFHDTEFHDYSFNIGSLDLENEEFDED